MNKTNTATGEVLRTTVDSNSSLVNSLYTIEFFDGRTATWKGCGAGTFSNLNQAQDALRGHREMCAGVVDFRIVLDINVYD